MVFADDVFYCVSIVLPLYTVVIVVDVSALGTIAAFIVDADVVNVSAAELKAVFVI